MSDESKFTYTVIIDKFISPFEKKYNTVVWYYSIIFFTEYFLIQKNIYILWDRIYRKVINNVIEKVIKYYNCSLKNELNYLSMTL